MLGIRKLRLLFVLEGSDLLVAPLLVLFIYFFRRRGIPLTKACVNACPFPVCVPALFT